MPLDRKEKEELDKTMDPLTKGFKTSEFAVTIGTILASLLVTFGVISVNQADSAAKLITDVVTGATALFVIYSTVSQYVKGRNDLKMTQLSKTLPPTTSI